MDTVDNPGPGYWKAVDAVMNSPDVCHMWDVGGELSDLCEAAASAAYPIIAEAVLSEAEKRINELDPVHAAIAGQYAYNDAAEVVADLRLSLRQGAK